MDILMSETCSAHNKWNKIASDIKLVFRSAHYIFRCGPGSSVGIATGYGLDGPGIESRWVARFSAPVQTGPGAHPTSCTMGTGSFPGVKSDRGMMLTSHLFLVPWSRMSRAIPLLPLWTVRTIQSLSIWTWEHFNFIVFFFTYFVTCQMLLHGLKYWTPIVAFKLRDPLCVFKAMCAVLTLPLLRATNGPHNWQYQQFETKHEWRHSHIELYVPFHGVHVHTNISEGVFFF